MAKEKIKAGGVTFLVDTGEGYVNHVTVTDVLEMDEGVDVVPFDALEGAIGRPFWQMAISMRGSMNQYHQAKAIRLGEKATHAMDIPNFMFPNVREVAVDEKNRTYASGKYLLKKTGYPRDGSLQLVNSFCLDNDETLDLTGISSIAPNALFGCGAGRIANSGEISSLPKEVFLASSFSLCREGESARVEDGRLLAAIDREAESIDIPAGVEAIGCDVQNGIKAKRLTVHGLGTLMALSSSGATFASAEELMLDMEPNASAFKASVAARNIAPNVRRVSLCGISNTMEAINGMLFTKGGRVLLYCPPCYGGDVKIPEGTYQVAVDAAHRLKADALILPDSLTGIGDDAFQGAKLKSVRFGQGLHTIPRAFQYAAIEELDMPPSIIMVGTYAFANATIGKLTFSDALISIGDSAFSNTLVKEIRLPASVKKVGYANFTKAEEISIDGGCLPEGLLDAITDSVTPVGSGKRGRLVRLHVCGKTYLIPEHIKPSSLNAFNQVRKLWDMGAMGEGLDAMLSTLFWEAGDTSVKQDAALTMAASGDARSKEYVKTAAQKMAQRYILDGDTESLARLLKLSLMTKKRLESLVAFAREQGGMEAVTYLMQAIDKAGGCGQGLSL